MITTGTKWFTGLGIVTFVLAAAYGWTTGGAALGPVTVGQLGPVGDHIGYGILMAASLVSFVLATAMAALRDSGARAEAEVAGLDTVPPVRPASPSYWPAISAFGVALLLIGLVTEPLLAIFGAIVLGAVLVEWTVQTWAEGATGDEATNRRIRNRIMNPIEFPVAGALAVAVVILSFSRVFLAISRLGAVGVALVVASVILFGGAWVAARPKLSSNTIVAITLVAAVLSISLGVVSGLSGEREFHPAVTEEGH